MVNKVFRAAIMAACVIVATPALATDINFSFEDGATSYFYGRDHAGGIVSGTLIGLTDNGISLPTSIKITNSPDALQFVEGTYTGNFYGTPGLTLVNGNVVASDLLFNFVDAASNAFQLRLNCTALSECPGISSGLNSLFWNGGNTPFAGTGNQAGFAGATYNNGSSVASAAPEPASWAMMLIGFGGAGYTLRRRPKVNTRIRFA